MTGFWKAAMNAPADDPAPLHEAAEILPIDPPTGSPGGPIAIFSPIGLLAAVLAGVSAATTLSLLLALLLGALTLGTAATSLGVGLIAGALTYTRCKDRFGPPPSFSSFDYLMIFFFTLFCFRQFFWLYIYKNGGIWSLNFNNLGDLPFHTLFIKYFANGARFWPENPLLAGEMLNYPFGMDLFAALFLRIGLPIDTVLSVTGFIMGLATLAALLYWGGGFTVAGFLFSGGIAGFAWLVGGTLKEHQATVIPLPWTALPTTTMIPQRGFLFAFPCGLFLLWCWRRRFISHGSHPPQKSDPFLLALEGLLWGTLPLFHVHTFIFLSALFAVWVAATRRFKEGFCLFLWAVVPAAFEMAMLTDFFKKGGIIWFKWGWLMEDHRQGPLLFFITQFGFLTFLFLVTLYDVVTKREREDELLLYPGLAFFSVCFYVVFAVWIVDNMKIMVWCYLLILPVMGRVFLDRVRPPWRIPLYILFFFSGFLAIFWQHRASNEGAWVAARKDLDGVCEATKNLPVSERFATVRTYNPPVALCGHPLAVGYDLHLWSHGIDTSVQGDQFKRLMMGDKAWRTISVSLQAHYLFWGPWEEGEYPGSTRPWEKEAVRIAQGEWGAIYDLWSQP